MKRLITIALLLTVLVVSGRSPRYIFYFIGDGMGFNHVSLASATLAAVADSIGYSKLSFSDFPFKGYATTHSANRLTTCSAAAGTALATGFKTSIGTIGMTADHSQNLESMAVLSKRSGLRVGIATTVSIDHATPAAFYAHATDRGKHTEIADWLPKAGFDLYVGSGLLKISPRYYDSISDLGYTVVRGREARLAGDKIVWVERAGSKVDNLALAIDRCNEDMSLPEIVDRSIEYLYCKRGFFLMVEGGQIDWAAHSNDASSVLFETLDFSEAVCRALEFYKHHSDETLIVVTADHETGGLSLGREDRGYDTDLGVLFSQGGSKDRVGDSVVREINRKSGVGFTTSSHTAAVVPVYAIGVGAELFEGSMDNTDIAKRIMQLIK